MLDEYAPSGGGTYTVLHHFDYTNGSEPYGELLASGGKFYGATRFGGNNDAGVLFEYDPSRADHVIERLLGLLPPAQERAIALVKIEGVHSWGCCAHCAMGCAARTGKDIEVHQADGLTGEPVIVKTLGGYVASIEPETAVAWFGKRKNAEGKFASAGCFHQGFFVNEENLRKWVQQRPLETGEAITIEQSLRDKMVLSPAQIQKACKVGECSPK